MTSRSRGSLGAVSSRLAKGFLLGPGLGVFARRRATSVWQRRTPGGGYGSAGSVAGSPSHVRRARQESQKLALAALMLAKRRRASPECAAMDEDRLLSRKELAAALG
jgi:hypothetical protein